MFIHHIATNMLIILSSYYRIGRAGILQFIIHDISDVPVDLSKLANFMKWKITTVVCFFIMLASWLYFRLYIFPVYMVYHGYLNAYYGLQEGVSPLLFLCFREVIASFSIMLVALHIYWFVLLSKMLFVFIYKKEIHDYSEHKKGEVLNDEIQKKNR